MPRVQIHHKLAGQPYDIEDLDPAAQHDLVGRRTGDRRAGPCQRRRVPGGRTAGQLPPRGGHARAMPGDRPSRLRRAAARHRLPLGSDRRRAARRGASPCSIATRPSSRPPAGGRSPTGTSPASAGQLTVADAALGARPEPRPAGSARADSSRGPRSSECSSCSGAGTQEPARATVGLVRVVDHADRRRRIVELVVTTEPERLRRARPALGQVFVIGLPAVRRQ